jgi:hypothetical protein
MKSSEYKNRGYNPKKVILELRKHIRQKEKASTSDNSQELSMCGGRQAPYLVPLEGGESEKKNRQSD